MYRERESGWLGDVKGRWNDETVGCVHILATWEILEILLLYGRFQVNKTRLLIPSHSHNETFVPEMLVQTQNAFEDQEAFISINPYRSVVPSLSL